MGVTFGYLYEKIIIFNNLIFIIPNKNDFYLDVVNSKKIVVPNYLLQTF